ncbi:pilin [candidate division KSB1 bacterium]
MKTFFVLAGLLVMPLSTNAQGLGGVLGTFSNLINLAIPIVLALAVLYFFWGLAQYILAQGSEDKREEGRNIMIWGIIALFVMVSIWGLIRLLQDTFNVGGQTPIVPGQIR